MLCFCNRSSAAPCRLDFRPASSQMTTAFRSREEFQRLLAVAGPRRALYLTAVFTGLRRGELAALEWDDVDLDAERPFLKARASTTKNRKDAVIGLHQDVVAELRLIRPRRPAPNQRIFEGLMPRIKRFRADLKRANVDYIQCQG